MTARASDLGSVPGKPVGGLLSPESIILLASLYCAQGLPSGLLAHALPALMRQQGVSLEVIGLLKLLALPWVLKVLWAPWVDRLASARLGHRRGWILPLQALVVGLLALIALQTPTMLFNDALWCLLLLVLLINLAAATQDVATDGLAVTLVPPRWRGLGNSLQVGGYKVGMVLSGSVLLVLIDQIGWAPGIGGLALLVALLTLPIFRFRESSATPAPAIGKEPAGLGLIWHSYRDFLQRPGILPWLLVVLTFKLGDALGSPMIKPMLVDQGWSLTAIGSLTLVASLAGIGGALVGGLAYAWLGAKRSLLLFGLLQALGLAAWVLVAGTGAPVAGTYAVALFEQVADGMSTVALFAVMMNQCRPGHEGADYTVQACAQVLLGGLVGGVSGFSTALLGYGGHFIGAGLLALAALTWVWLYFRRVDSAQGQGQGHGKSRPVV